MTPLLITTTTSNGVKAMPVVMHITTQPLVSDAECTIEAISVRANHIGPVLAGILHEMEEHWDEGEDLEI